jgi:hypothetical protein
MILQNPFDDIGVTLILSLLVIKPQKQFQISPELFRILCIYHFPYLHTYHI